MLYYIILYHVILYYITLNYTISSYILFYHILFYHIILLYTMACNEQKHMFGGNTIGLYKAVRLGPMKMVRRKTGIAYNQRFEHNVSKDIRCSLKTNCSVGYAPFWTYHDLSWVWGREVGRSKSGGKNVITGDGQTFTLSLYTTLYLYI